MQSNAGIKKQTHFISLFNRNKQGCNDSLCYTGDATSCKHQFILSTKQEQIKFTNTKWNPFCILLLLSWKALYINNI